MKRTTKPQPEDFDLLDLEPKPYYTLVPPISKEALEGMPLLDKLDQLMKIAESCRLNDDFFQIHGELIQSVADELQLTPSQTVMLCPCLSDSESMLNTSAIKNYFGCSSITIMQKAEDLKILARRRYIRKSCSWDSNTTHYGLTARAKNAFCNNQALPIIETTNLTAEAFMKHFRLLVVEVGEHKIEENDMHQETLELLKGNPHLSIVQNICSLNVPDPDKVYLLYYCKRLVIDNNVQVPLSNLRFLAIDEPDDEFPFLMSRGTHPFLKEGLMTNAGQDGLQSSDVFQLTEKARALFLSEYDLPDDIDECEEGNHSSTIKCSDIKTKSMFYSADDRKQIETLQDLLQDEQLQAIRERLEKANLRKGFNCLFYGGPGTGKTETVLQLARMTGRDIIQVDIASIRDKWYGETEKIVKDLFDSYAERVKKAKRIPILLINEADAVLSVRTSVGGTNPTLEKTENAIQNILLQAMEDNEGIMIATTNLTCNLDSAFDRRFLYKVEFHQPSVEAKTHIWQSFIPDLAAADANVLARTYDFSGGQIENIARKVMVDHLLFGGKPDLSHIEELCSQEKISGRGTSSRRPIGFKS